MPLWRNDVGSSTSPSSQVRRHFPVSRAARRIVVRCIQAESLRFLILDRDALFTAAFDAAFTADDIEIIKTPPHAPRANAICERMVGTLRRELLDRLLIINRAHLHRVLDEYLIHYNGHRPHRSLGQRPPNSTRSTPPTMEPIQRRRILTRLINEYHRAA